MVDADANVLEAEPVESPAESGSVREALKLAWRCWPYYRPQAKHLATFVLINSVLGALVLGAAVIGTDLIENKIILGEKLEPLQATMLLLDEDFVASAGAADSQLGVEQRKAVRERVIVLAGILAALLLEAVRIENIEFGYQPDRMILKGASLSAKTGTVTAIVGATGSGKSTLMSMLLRLYNPDSGAVRVNEVELSQISAVDVRANVAIALQQNVLFATSVADNIRYGRTDVDEGQVTAAAQVACADEFIRAMPDGYDTELGERGGKLSTGQRQRISIARAVLRDTPILILDEPTASLDAQTERRGKE